VLYAPRDSNAGHVSRLVSADRLLFGGVGRGGRWDRGSIHGGLRLALASRNVGNIVESECSLYNRGINLLWVGIVEEGAVEGGAVEGGAVEGRRLEA
jgi:hypothetical protein